jgi:ATP-dependent Lon protease
VMPPGLCFALSEYSAQHVECSIYGTLPVDEPEESRLHITGKVDQVMRESCMIAYTYARNFLAAVDRSNGFFQKWALHVHLPEGAMEKSGTGAGCAVVTALLSLAMNRPLRRDLVISGELTLTGKVLPVSNVKALALSAKRHDANLILLPRANEAEWDDLDSSLRSGLQPHFIDYYSDVFGVAFAEHQPVEAVKSETPASESTAEADS